MHGNNMFIKNLLNMAAINNIKMEMNIKSETNEIIYIKIDKITIRDMNRLMNMNLTDAIKTYLRIDIKPLESRITELNVEEMRKETELMLKAMIEFGNIIFNKYKVDITQATSASSLSNRVFRLNT
jgi:hypothetical protein